MGQANLVQTVLSRAAKEARRFCHEYIGTEHLLLALAQDGENEPLLYALGVTEANVRPSIERLCQIGPAENSLCELRCTPRAKESLEHAWRLAKKAAAPQIGVEHLLSGLSVGDAVSKCVLEGLGVTPPVILRAQQLLDSGVSPETIRERWRPADALSFAAPLASDLYVAAKIQTIREAEKAMWEKVYSARFEEAARLRDEIQAEVQGLRKYCGRHQ